MNLLPTKSRILVVDDSSDNLFLVESILEEEGHELILVNDGAAALEIVETSPPHLILLDVMMPGLDGFEVTQRIRTNSHLPFIPILLITAYDQPSAVKGLDLGADDFLRKPVDMDELLARVRSLLRLKHSVDEQERMTQMREDFVSRLTHDLRTPLVAADRMLTLMQDGALGGMSEKMTEAVATMTRSNQNLLKLVNNLLEVYRYEADRKVLNFTQVNLLPLIQEVIHELEFLAQDKALDLSLASSEESAVVMKGDRLELRRLFTNLIGNAIKFTDQGAITVTLIHQPPSWVVCQVRDTGIGISDEMQRSLFNRFSSGRHRSSGSGLGLHLSRQIVESHHGTIEVQSEVGRGSIFTVRLPLS